MIRENKKLLKELEDVYHQLIVIKNEQETARHTTPQGDEKGKWSLAFYSSNAPFLHYIPQSRVGGRNYFDALERLSELKQNGLLTESEFKTFKEYLLKEVKNLTPV